jgi:hypothetical protein
MIEMKAFKTRLTTLCWPMMSEMGKADGKIQKKSLAICFRQGKLEKMSYFLNNRAKEDYTCEKNLSIDWVNTFLFIFFLYQSFKAGDTAIPEVNNH